jgi:flavin reductase (DIM6/NTAB) family NADH-FMN oxidoreductase RutF
MAAVPPGMFREALSRFASGVVIVTCYGAEGPVGFTVSAFSSVSLDPPLVLVCVARTASAYDAIVSAGSFGISILEAKQAWVASQFARQGVDRFAGIELRADAGVPLIEGAIAQLVCARHALHEAGDHTIVVGAVVDVRHSPGDALIHYAREFGAFSVRDPSFADD